MEKLTTIAVYPSTRKKLDSIRIAKRESFDEIINRLVNEKIFLVK